MRALVLGVVGGIGLLCVSFVIPPMSTPPASR